MTSIPLAEAPAFRGIARRTAIVRVLLAAAVLGTALATALSAPTPCMVGSRSALPIDPRSAFQPHGLADAAAAITPVAPAASATRTIAPTFPGS